MSMVRAGNDDKIGGGSIPSIDNVNKLRYMDMESRIVRKHNHARTFNVINELTIYEIHISISQMIVHKMLARTMFEWFGSSHHNM